AGGGGGGHGGANDGWSRPGGEAGREDRVHGRARGLRRGQEDQRHQGGPRDHRPGPQGGQGRRRGQAQAHQGKRLQGRGGKHQEEARGGRRQGVAQVAASFSRELSA